MVDIFVSYAKEDQERIRPLISILEKEGWTVFWDHISPVGKPWQNTIEESLKTAGCVLVGWSQDSINSKWIQREAETGKRAGKLIPFLLDKVEAPSGFSNIHTVDLTDWNGYSVAQELLELFEAIIEIIYPETLPHEAPREGATNKSQDSIAQTSKRTIRVPDINWVEIPEGSFIYGEKNEAITLHIDAFEIACYPITNAQYQCFIDDGGYDDERWWSDLKKPVPGKSSWPQTNRPRTNVDWFEATAFCRWLSLRLGEAISLPTEQQWEKAARGEKGLKYPWGDSYQNGYTNVDESQHSGAVLKETTAVGVYPRDQSPYGVRDLCGNVMEWCINLYDESDSKPNTGEELHGLRGGSWFHGPEFARAARRNKSVPLFDRYDLMGFRLVRSTANSIFQAPKHKSTN